MTRARPIHARPAAGAATVLLVAALTVSAARRERPRPGPRAERRPVRPEPGARVRVALRRGAADRDPDRDPGRVERRHGEPRVEGRDDRLQCDRTEPDRLRAWRPVRRQRPGLLLAQRADGLLDVAPRAGPRLRLGDAQVVPVVHDRAQRVLRRGDDRARRIRARRRPRPSRELRGRPRLRGRVVQTYLADQADGRLERACVRGLRPRRRSSAATTCSAGPRSTRRAPASPRRSRSAPRRPGWAMARP